MFPKSLFSFVYCCRSHLLLSIVLCFAPSHAAHPLNQIEKALLHLHAPNPTLPIIARCTENLDWKAPPTLPINAHKCIWLRSSTVKQKWRKSDRQPSVKTQNSTKSTNTNKKTLVGLPWFLWFPYLAETSG